MITTTQARKEEVDEERSDVMDEDRVPTPVFASAHSSHPLDLNIKRSLNLDTPSAYIKISSLE
jgi:hypothetical protein